uniref:Putative secreted protein n=1 Tax=Anopheles darlingi TaxID=43151 RepID=A0A2M4DDU3_ANODA
MMLLSFPIFLLLTQLGDRGGCMGLGALQKLQHWIAHPVLDCRYRCRWCHVLIADTTTTNGCGTSGGRCWIH